MDVYINAISSISYQQTFENKSLKGFTPLTASTENQSYEPVYKELLNPKRIRRLGRTIRMGLACATDCLKEAGLEKPNAILVGTGWGCVQDTYKFLSVLKENNEDILNPTPFIQSTHNTVAGQIALMMGCKEYNMTFTHNDLSFESAIIDGVSLLKDGAAGNVMIGGIDELTELQSELIARSGKLYDGIIGDGAGFFIVSSKKSQSSYAHIRDIKIINANADEFNSKLEHYLQRNELSGDSIDLVLTNNESLFTISSVDYTKYCGNYDTANAFGLWIASIILKENQLEELGVTQTKRPERILLHNAAKDGKHSLIILENVEL